MTPAGAPPRLSAALKEWAAVCRALGEGRQTVLLRKGGIVEKGGGFALESPWFFLLPTLEHQNAADLAVPLDAPGGPPEGPFPVSLLAFASDVFPVPDLARAKALRPFTVYTDALVEKRWAYRPDRPLHAVVLRAFRVAPVTVPADPRYAGCVSWTELSAPLSTAGASPVLAEEAFQEARRRVRAFFP